MFGLGAPEMFILLLLGLVIVLPLAALIDVLPNEFAGSNKVVWLLVNLFIPILGPLLYFGLGKKSKIPQG